MRTKPARKSDIECVAPVQPSSASAVSSGVAIDHNAEILLTVCTWSSMGKGAMRKSIVPDGHEA